jgi:DnaJ-domain-containing protein 1
MSWFDFAFGVASKAAKKTFGDLRTEFEAGRQGKQSPREKAQQRPGPTATRVGPAWWHVLGVRREATLAEVTVAYRDRIRQNHPDKVAHLSVAIRQVAESETRRLNAAYAEAQQILGRP